MPPPWALRRRDDGSRPVTDVAAGPLRGIGAAVRALGGAVNELVGMGA